MEKVWFEPQVAFIESIRFTPPSWIQEQKFTEKWDTLILVVCSGKATENYYPVHSVYIVLLPINGNFGMKTPRQFVIYDSRNIRRVYQLLRFWKSQFLLVTSWSIRFSCEKIISFIICDSRDSSIVFLDSWWPIKFLEPRKHPDSTFLSALRWFSTQKMLRLLLYCSDHDENRKTTDTWNERISLIYTFSKRGRLVSGRENVMTGEM